MRFAMVLVVVLTLSASCLMLASCAKTKDMAEVGQPPAGPSVSVAADTDPPKPAEHAEEQEATEDGTEEARGTPEPTEMTDEEAALAIFDEIGAPLWGTAEFERIWISGYGEWSWDRTALFTTDADYEVVRDYYMEHLSAWDCVPHDGRPHDRSRTWWDPLEDGAQVSISLRNAEPVTEIRAYQTTLDPETDPEAYATARANAATAWGTDHGMPVFPDSHLNNMPSYGAHFWTEASYEDVLEFYDEQLPSWNATEGEVHDEMAGDFRQGTWENADRSKLVVVCYPSDMGGHTGILLELPKVEEEQMRLLQGE